MPAKTGGALIQQIIPKMLCFFPEVEFFLPTFFPSAVLGFVAKKKKDY
jgi:hypothetical protein